MSLASQASAFLHSHLSSIQKKILGLNSARRNRLALFIGIISAAAFAPLSLWPILPLAFAILFWLVDAARTPMAAARTGWWFSFGQLVAGLYWIAISWQYQANMPVMLGVIAVLLLSAYLALFAALSCFGSRKLWHDRPSRIFIFAVFWAMGEWLRGIAFTGFPWNAAGSAWLPVLPIAQWAAVFGVFGLSLLMVLCGGALALMASSVKIADQSLKNSGTGLLILILSGTAYIFLTPLSVWPNLQLHIVQANIGQETKWSADDFRKPLQQHLAMTQEAIAERGPGIVIWPETAVPNLIDEEITTRYLISRALGEESLLLTGADRAVRSPEGEILAAHNSLMVLNSSGTISDIYDKVHLVPFGEYLPMRGLLDPLGISRLAPGSIDFLPGPKVRTLAVDQLPKVGPLICYEAIFAGQVTDRANRPDWLLNISNDAWFGRSSGPPQHLAQARLRAIEEGLPMVRSTPTGITAVIDGHGRILSRLPAHKAGVLTSTLPKPLSATPYARTGDISFFLLASAILFLGVRRTSAG
jgi:apolipoprotein N-acyltransferase